jgi:hypothetical protein
VTPDAATWARVTRHAPVVLVQKRIHGARLFINCVYEHGVERAAVMHEKIASFPTFGPTAFAVTRRVDDVHEYAQRIFSHLRWHGPVNIEFRQDTGDRRWYFMEINPRFGASLGIQDPAGIDLARAWAAVSRDDGDSYTPGRDYRTGVRFAWGVRGWRWRCGPLAHAGLGPRLPAQQPDRPCIARSRLAPASPAARPVDGAPRAARLTLTPPARIFFGSRTFPVPTRRVPTSFPEQACLAAHVWTSVCINQSVSSVFSHLTRNSVSRPRWPSRPIRQGVTFPS